MRAFHESMAAAYRQLEERHRMSAALQAAYAERLLRWRSGPPRSVRFMTSVAETSGGLSAALTLGAQGQVDAVTVASNETASAAQQLELQLREGPARDAIRSRELVLAVDQAFPERWPRYGPDLAGLGVRAVAAAPLVAGRECLGALTVFGDPPMCASAGVDRLRSVVAALTESVLLEPASTAIGDDDVPHFPVLEEDEEWPIVHQAAGMLAARNGCSVADAFAMIRSHAFAESMTIPLVAEQIVHRELVLPED